ncbi:MAG: Shedu anti-phage system protein SduA domain-containing protein [Desulfosalsimonadaceae bacterium]
MDIIEFEAALVEPCEEITQEYLSRNTEISVKAFFPVGSYLCFPKFRFGLDFVSDFILVQLWSTTTRILLIELEPPTVTPFNRNGTFGRRLNGAIQQVISWNAWIRDNNQHFIDLIARKVQRDNPNSYSAISTRLKYNTILSKIIIGRRAHLSDKDNTQRAAFYLDTQERIEILPYDRLLDVVKHKIRPDR